jgi:hypothetical protein
MNMKRKFGPSRVTQEDKLPLGLEIFPAAEPLDEREAPTLSGSVSSPQVVSLIPIH